MEYRNAGRPGLRVPAAATWNIDPAEVDEVLGR